MTYATNIQETQMVSMPQLFKITIGGVSEYYTDYSTNITFLFHEYLAVPIKRTSFSRDNDFRALETTITTIPTDTLRKYIALQPVEPVEVVIYRSITTDLTSYTTLFRGVIKGVQFANGQVQAACIANTLYLKKKIPRFLYQAFCNHTLFDTRCGANRLSYKLSGTLTYVLNTTLKADAFATKPDGYFDQGYVQIGDDMRLIIKHTTDTLIIHAPFDSRAVASVVVDAYPGCDKDPDTCKSKFNRFTDGFLGCPSIPTINPVLVGFK